MGIFRRADNRQAITGLFLLVALAVFAGPNMLPRLIARIIPFADEGVPCEWLRTAEGRAQHQSLIGRAAADPILVAVESSPLPNTPDGTLVISITVINRSVGSVPFVFNPRQVLIGDNGSSGLGIIFNPVTTLTTGAVRQDAGSYAESDIRVLGPRQRCVHKIEFTASQVNGSPILGTGTVSLVAYYRNNARGQVISAQGDLATPTFGDQGLWTGYIESEPAIIPLASQ